ncbi:class I SAM-dependent methyltransferase [bacterium]|nr:class I SAM-dependent methyltransferase [bacterium]MBU1651403.1 class I SAM-dependent methyltransferase [bacterium]
MNTNNWFQDWFGADYLELYKRRSPQEAAETVAWIISVLKLDKSIDVFDLACGAGRHRAELISRGFQVTGLDLSWQLLKQAKTNNPQKLLRGDMRYIPVRANQFDLVLSLFTSFGYFQDDADNALVLSEAARILKPGGMYVLDFLNETRLRSEIVPSDETKINGKQVKILRWIDDVNNRIEKRIMIAEAERTFREYRESVKLYTKEQLTTMLSAAGIRPVSIFGDYRDTPFSKSSPRLIIFGEKHGA